MKKKFSPVGMNSSKAFRRKSSDFQSGQMNLDKPMIILIWDMLTGK